MSLSFRLVDGEGSTALHLAAASEKVEIVTMLLEAVKNRSKQLLSYVRPPLRHINQFAGRGLIPCAREIERPKTYSAQSEFTIQKSYRNKLESQLVLDCSKKVDCWLKFSRNPSFCHDQNPHLTRIHLKKNFFVPGQTFRPAQICYSFVEKKLIQKRDDWKDDKSLLI